MREFKRIANAERLPPETGLDPVVRLEKALVLHRLKIQSRINKRSFPSTSPAAKAKRFARLKRVSEALNIPLTDIIATASYRRGRKGEPAFVLVEPWRRKPKTQRRWYDDANDRQPKARLTGAAKRPLPKRAYDRDGLSRLGAPTGVGYREGADWARTTPYLKLQFSHYALQAINLEYEDHLGQAFTLNIGDDVAAKMLASNSPKRFLSRAMAASLREALGRGPVEFWFVFELSQGGSPYHHIHGEVLLRPGERPKARAALRKAGGEWGRRKGVPHFQVKYEADLPDDGWVSYAVKDERLNSIPILRRLAGSSKAPIWMQDGLHGAFFITEKLKRLAGLFYESARPHVRLTPNTMKAMKETIARAEARAAAKRTAGKPSPAGLPVPPI